MRVGDRPPSSAARGTSSTQGTNAQKTSAPKATAASGGRQQFVDSFEPSTTTRRTMAAQETQATGNQPTDEEINTIIDENFQAVYGRPPTDAERQEWQKYAQDMRAQGHGAYHIKQMMLSGIHEEK